MPRSERNTHDTPKDAELCVHLNYLLRHIVFRLFKNRQVGGRALVYLANKIIYERDLLDSAPGSGPIFGHLEGALQDRIEL